MSQARVWIELERPKHEDFGQRISEGARIAMLANNMLARLNWPNKTSSHFWWSDNERRFCYGDPMGYRTLTDDGEWFNLEYFGRSGE